MIYLTKNISHLFVKIGFFYRINVALKRGQIYSELFGLRITECDLRNDKTTKTGQNNVRFSEVMWESLLKPSVIFLLTTCSTYFAFDLDLSVCQPSSHFFHKCQVKQMVLKPTEQNKNKTEFPAGLRGKALVIGFAIGKVWGVFCSLLEDVHFWDPFTRKKKW